MKQNYLKKLMTALLLLCCTAASAQYFEVDGIYYNILSSEDKTVEVTSGSNKYTGAVTIPASVTYNSITYSVTSIGQSTFYNCTDLTSIEIPSSVTSIGGSAFFYCYNLTSIEIPSSVTSIGSLVFFGCSGLTSIEIPSSVTNIGSSAFEECAALTSIVIPNGVTSMGDMAFAYCSGLTSVEISEGVTSIGNFAFFGCTSLVSVVSRIAAEDLFAINAGTFSGIDEDACTLYVPAGAAATYAATDAWCNFRNIVEMSPAGYSLTVTAAGYATMYLGTAVEIPAGVEAYTANRIEGDLLKMQAVEDVIPANTAVIIKAEEGNYTFIPSDETPEAIEDNLLRGTLTDTYVKPSALSVAYVLSKVDGVVGMYRAKLKADGTFKNNANRVYMLLGDINVGEGDLDTSNPGSQLSNGYRFDFSGTTAIESVQTESAAPAVYYDLSGRRVENPTRGIYIVGGKKVFVK